MNLNADHLGFVIAAYGLSGVFILALTIYVLLKDRTLRAAAQHLDRQRREDGP